MASRRAGSDSPRGAASRPKPPAAVGLVPGGHGGVAQQHGRVRGHRRAEQRGPGGCGRPGGGQDAGDVGQRGRARGRAVGAEQPGPHAHGRGQLEHAEHMVKPGGPPEVVDEEHRGQADAAEGGRLRGPGQPPAAGQLRRRGQHRGGARQATEEQVAGDVRLLPHRFLDDGPAVVGAEFGARHHELLAATAVTVVTATAAAPAVSPRACVPAPAADARLAPVGPVAGTGPGLGRAHRRPVPDPANAASTMAPTPAAARPACFHMRGRDRVDTTGSGGRP